MLQCGTALSLGKDMHQADNWMNNALINQMNEWLDQQLKFANHNLPFWMGAFHRQAPEPSSWAETACHQQHTGRAPGTTNRATWETLLACWPCTCTAAVCQLASMWPCITDQPNLHSSSQSASMLTPWMCWAQQRGHRASFSLFCIHNRHCFLFFPAKIQQLDERKLMCMYGLERHQCCLQHQSSKTSECICMEFSDFWCCARTKGFEGVHRNLSHS